MSDRPAITAVALFCCPLPEGKYRKVLISTTTMEELS
jgi:hypothetical protein